MNHWKPELGLPYPMGAKWNGTAKGYNFSIYSKLAKKVTILFFASGEPSKEIFRYDFDILKNKTGTVWHCFIEESDIKNADCYAYSIDGTSDLGNHFDKEKLLLDPWAKAVFFPKTFSRDAALHKGSNIGKAPLGLLGSNKEKINFFKDDPKPFHYNDLIIYEIHVKGFTANSNSGIASTLKGTFSAIVEKIPYLKELGVTAVELMPVHQFDPQEGNYWGYMTLNFFAPYHLYGSADGSLDTIDEFKKMVLALHKAGMEVILDVIYNHTVEGDGAGPCYSYKGIDNSSYYLLTKDMGNYFNDAGTGNVMRTSYKMVRKMVIDSLRYWVEEMNVDGFRFDLATIFTRNDDGSVNLDNPPILEEISMDPVLSSVRLIAEPWDINSYQLGQKFPGAIWAQWNGSYRDDIRRFVKSDEGMVAKAMTRIYGSPDLFKDGLPSSNKPYQSINFINCHDGFSLYDLVAYNGKHNGSNGFNNQDGTDDNYSWNCGWEGDANLPSDILELRKRQARNLFAILMFSNGIPMFRMGDEFLHTQKGNNNPFNQDNEISWLNWDRLTEFSDIFRFFKMLIQCRKSHPSICRGTFWANDIQWFGVNGQTDISYYSRTLAYFLNGSALDDDDFYVMVNCYWQPLDFKVQVGAAGNWKCIIDTFKASPEDVIDFDAAPVVNANIYTVRERSVVVLQRNKA